MKPMHTRSLAELLSRLRASVRPAVLLRMRALRPFRRWLRHRALWTAERDTVARGVAIGLFFGILIPVAQIFFAAIAAVALRANLAIAALTTLVTNPLTFPVVYYAAYRIGSILLPGNGAAVRDVEMSEEAAEQALEVTGWIPTLIDWATSVGPALATGLLILAIGAAGAGYLLVHVAWGVAHLRRRRPPPDRNGVDR